jgi:hypothetical protein
MVNRRDALKLTAGVALGSQFGSALASEGQETTPAQELSGIFLAGATGGQQVPPVETEAQGTAVFAVDEDGDGIDYALAVQDIEDVTMAHIHVSQVGENGPVVAWLYPEEGQEPEPISGEFDGMLAEGTITEDDLTGPLEDESLETLLGGLRGGAIYVNVHTEENPEGEVRGQVVKVTQMVNCLGLEEGEMPTPTPKEPTASLVVSDQSGDGETVVVDEASANVSYYVDAHYDDETVRTSEFEANTTQEQVQITLDPPVTEDTTMEIAVHAAEDGEELTGQEILYEVEEEETPTPEEEEEETTPPAEEEETTTVEG